MTAPTTWAQRAARCAQVVGAEGAHIIGFQEMQTPNLEVMSAALSEYAYLPGPPNSHELGGFPNYNTIFWHRGRFTYLNSGGFYLSPTPEVPSSGWGYMQTRVLNWVRLRDKQTAQQLIFANTHLPHDNGLARSESCNVIAATLLSLSQGAPVVLVGDFNDRANPPTAAQRRVLAETFGMIQTAKAGEIRSILEEAAFRDEALRTLEADQNTFHGFLGEALPPIGHRLDWILTRDGDTSIKMTSVRVLTTSSPPLFPSDHYPVVAQLQQTD